MTWLLVTADLGRFPLEFQLFVYDGPYRPYSVSLFSSVWVQGLVSELERPWEV
jgi:hypothetical protein